MITSRPAVLKKLFEASMCPASANVAVAEICGAMWAAAFALGDVGPTGVANGDDADDKANKSVDEDC
jgi:hypothetical protein